MKIIVDTKNYTPFKYDEFLGETKQGDSPYVVGQVVVCRDSNENEEGQRFCLGVVLGCIDHKTEEVRTDAIGMVTYDKIRPATIEDFNNSKINCTEKLLMECKGFKVSFNWDTYETTIENPNKAKYYQPDFGDDETLVTPDGTELWSYYVYSSLEKAKEDFPDRKINEYSEGDIEEPYIIK